MPRFNFGKTSERIGTLALFLAACYSWFYHFYTITVLPDPLFEPDSGSYLSGPLQQMLGQGFIVPASRGLGYPLFLWTGLKIFKNFYVILWFQHFLWMAMAGTTVALFLKYCPRRSVWGAMLLFIVGCSPMGALFSHSILTDAFYTVWEIAAIGGLLGIFGESPYANGIVCGVSLVMAMNTRPTGKLLLLSVALVYLMHWRVARYRRTAMVSAISFVVMISPFLLYNYSRRHLVGLETFGTFYAVGDALKHIIPSEIKDVRTRELLTPFYSPDLRNKFQDSNWIWHSADGPLAALKADPAVQRHIETVYRQLLIQAMVRHPFSYLADLLQVCFVMLREGTRNSQTVPDKMVSVLFAVKTYYGFTTLYPAARGFLCFQPETAGAYFSKLQSLALPPFDKRPILFFPIWLLAQTYALLSWIGILSLAWLLFRAWRTPVVQILFFTTIGQIMMVAVGGVFVPRYGIPLEPLYALATFLAFSNFGKSRPKLSL